MRITSSKAVAVLRELSREGERIAECLAEGRFAGQGWENERAADVWATSVYARLVEVFGETDARTAGFGETISRSLPSGLYDVELATMRLYAAIRDLEQGALSGVAGLVAGEIFDDFLEMAGHLAENGYHVAAASLSGAVLEDHLRRLCPAHAVTWTGDSSISRLNDPLFKAGAYPQNQWRQVQVWGDIRNDADHGNFVSVDAAAVDAMIKGVRAFVVNYPA